MAANLNTVILAGNLTRDPEVRYTSGGTAVGRLGLAINKRYNNKDGQTVEKTTFVDIDVWSRQAETCQRYLSKGAPVLIEGELELDQWQDSNTGQNRSRLKVRANRVQFLGSPRADAAPNPQSPAPPPYRNPPTPGSAIPPAGSPPPPAVPDDLDQDMDGIPF